jgi:hypothetical protein
LIAAIEILPTEDLRSLYDELIAISKTESQLEEALSPQELAVEWASKLFRKLFTSDVENLLKEHPLDELDDEGNSFWGGARRRPVPLHLDVDDVYHKEFLVSASKLWLQLYKSAEKVYTTFEYTPGNVSLAELKDDFDLKNKLLSKIKCLKETRKIIAQSIEPMVNVF